MTERSLVQTLWGTILINHFVVITPVISFMKLYRSTNFEFVNSAKFKSLSVQLCWLKRGKRWEVVVAQLVEQSLLIPEIRGSTPVIGKILLYICLLSTVLKRRK